MPSSSAPSDSAWVAIARDRFVELWDALPALTVLTSLPGWGRTEWMRSCRARLDAAGGHTAWISSRDALTHLLAAPAADGPMTYFLDDVLATRSDSLWPEVVAVAQRPGIRIVASSFDVPDARGADITVLDERDLRFTDDEIARLVSANALTVAPEALDELSMRLRGCPALVRTQIERLAARRQQQVWASLAPALERNLVGRLLDARDPALADSDVVGMLRRGGAFRRFSSGLLERTGPAAFADAAQFDRLAAIPLGDIDVDDETGAADFVWSPAAWRAWGAADTAQRRAQLDDTLTALAADGRVTGRLFPLLELERFEEADALVFDQMRRFLLFVDAPTQDALLGMDVNNYPSLLLLTGELRLRTRGANAQTVRGAQRCIEAFAPESSDDGLTRFRLHCRRAMAATYAGRRALAVRHLETVADQLDRDAGSSVRRVADRDRAAAGRIATDLFLVFWAAVQTDRHDLALAFIEVMQEYGDPADVVTQIDLLTAITEEDFAGLRSFGPADITPEGLEFSHAAALVLLEEGDDAEALARTHALAARVRPAPTRSAADALLLLTRALIAPDRLDGRFVDAVVRLSSSFWDDGRPSSFIGYSAVLAHLASGRVDAASTLATGLGDDWFALTSRAMLALNVGDGGAAVRALESAAPHAFGPRQRAIGDVLAAAAFAQQQHEGAAAARLESLWAHLPAPRLVRFALRHLHAGDFAALAALSLSDELAAVLVAASGDRRPAPAPPGAALSPAEVEILALLRRGLSNAALATERGVTHNTIRTQLRLLYRKLGVTNRAEAVSILERSP